MPFRPIQPQYEFSHGSQRLLFFLFFVFHLANRPSASARVESGRPEFARLDGSVGSRDFTCSCFSLGKSFAGSVETVVARIAVPVPLSTAVLIVSGGFLIEVEQEPRWLKRTRLREQRGHGDALPVRWLASPRPRSRPRFDNGQWYCHVDFVIRERSET